MGIDPLSCLYFYLFEVFTYQRFYLFSFLWRKLPGCGHIDNVLTYITVCFSVYSENFISEIDHVLEFFSIYRNFQIDTNQKQDNLT